MHKKSTNKSQSEEKIKHHVELDVSTMTIIKILVVIIFFSWTINLLGYIQSILIMVSVCLILTVGLSSLLDKIERYKIPRPLAILFIYILVLSLLAVLFLQVIPLIAQQIFGIGQDLQALVSNKEISIPFLNNLGIELDLVAIQELISENLISIAQNLQTVVGSGFTIIGSVFSGIFNFFFTLVLLFFMLLEKEIVGNFALALLPEKHREYSLEKYKEVQKKLSSWFRGQFILMLSIGGGFYIGMKIFEYAFGMEYAATIAIFAGFMELFPYIGATFSGILALVVAINVSSSAFIATIIWVGCLQFLEVNFLVPIVMKRAVGLSSVVVILVLAIGGSLGYALGGVPVSILGMIFSVPISASIDIFIQDYIRKIKK